MGEIIRHFRREFKVNAVQLVTEKKMSLRHVAEDLDIHPPSSDICARLGNADCHKQGAVGEVSPVIGNFHLVNSFIWHVASVQSGTG